MKEPLVSVLMTAYNREIYIAEAIESVLASTYKNFELIIIDDCSTDGTLEILNHFKNIDRRIQVYINKENVGQFKNRNKAATFAKAEYIKYFDSDDVMKEDMLEILMEGILKFPNSGMAVTCEIPNTKQHYFPLKFSPKETYTNYYFKGHFTLIVGPSGTIYKKSIFNKVGGFNESIGILADTLLSLQIGAISNIVNVKSDLFIWRIHKDQVTIGQNNYFEMVKEKHNINELVLNSINCPFSINEIVIVKRNLKNIFIRNSIVLIKKFIHLRKNRSLFKLQNILFIDIIKALIPNKTI